MKTQNRDFDYETEKGGPTQVKEDEYPEKGIRYYQALVNQKSLDGLPGLEVAFKVPLTSMVKERLPNITEPSSLSKARKGQGRKECESGCEPAEAGNVVRETKIGYLKKVEEGKFLLLAFIFGLVLATYLPPAAKVIRSDLRAVNSTLWPTASL